MVQESAQEFHVKLASAFHTSAQNEVAFEYFSDAAISVCCAQDYCVLGRLALPSFVDALREKLHAEDKDDLIVVPHSKHSIHATLFTSFRGCCEVGRLTDADHSNPPDGLLSVPFSVRSLNRTKPELELIKSGVAPIQWERYRWFGCSSMMGIAFADGVVRFPVPCSKEQAVVMSMERHHEFSI